MPLIEKFSPQRFVKFDRLLIPLDYLPLHSVAIFLHRNARYESQQRLPNPSAAKQITHKQILQIQSPPHPGRVTAEKEGISRRLRIPLRNQRAKAGIWPKPIPRQIRLFNHTKIQLVLKLRQLADHRPQQCHVMRSRRSNREHSTKEYMSGLSAWRGCPPPRIGWLGASCTKLSNLRR